MIFHATSNLDPHIDKIGTRKKYHKLWVVMNLMKTVLRGYLVNIISLYLSLYHSSLSLSASLPIPLSIHLHNIYIYISLSIHPSFSPLPPPIPPLPLSPIPLSPSLYLSVSVCLCLSLSLHMSLSVNVCRAPYTPHYNSSFMPYIHHNLPIPLERLPVAHLHSIVPHHLSHVVLRLQGDTFSYFSLWNSQLHPSLHVFSSRIHILPTSIFFTCVCNPCINLFSAP